MNSLTKHAIEEMFIQPKRFSQDDKPSIGQTVCFSPTDNRTTFCHTIIKPNELCVVQPFLQEYTKTRNVVFVKFIGDSVSYPVSPDFLTSPLTVKQEHKQIEEKLIELYKSLL